MLFDLDGTLSDSEPGIAASLRHAFEAHGLPPLERGAGARACSARRSPNRCRAIVAADRVDASSPTYREHYRAGGMFDATVYPGIAELLDVPALARGARWPSRPASPSRSPSRSSSASG